VVDYEWRGEVSSTEINVLHAEAFNTRLYSDEEWDWVSALERFSLGWVTAREDGELVGFANVLTDGFFHAFLEDVMISARARRGGVGRRVVAEAAAGARAAGCETLHVDFEEPLGAFYFDACGFEPTPAGLLRLQG
jgi:GNAT superfamily N-acetyltransferase